MRGSTRKTLGLLLLLAIFGAPCAGAQGFSVQPMKVSTNASAGARVTFDLTLTAAAGAPGSGVQFAVTDLKQYDNGSLSPVASDGADPQYTAKEWLRLPAGPVMVNVGEPRTVTFTVEVPSVSPGVYHAGLFAAPLAPEDQAGVDVLVRYFIPVIVTVSNPGSKDAVAATGIELVKIENPKPDSPDAALAFTLTNTGRTAPTIMTEASIMRDFGGVLRKVATCEFRNVRVLPNQSTRMKAELSRRLPAGSYVIDLAIKSEKARIFTDRLSFEYEGSAAGDTAVAESEITLEQDVLLIDVGAKGRPVDLGVTSFAEAPVTLRPTLQRISTMVDAMMGDVSGAIYDATPYLSIQPPLLHIMPAIEKRLLIRADFSNLPPVPYLFAELAVPIEPQVPGFAVEKCLLVVRNSAVAPAARLYGYNIVPSTAGEGTLRFTGRFGNVGDTPEEARCRFTLVDIATGETAFERSIEPAEAGPALPLSPLSFEADVPSTQLKEGNYRMIFSVEYSSGVSSISAPVEFKMNNSGKLLLASAGDLERDERAKPVVAVQMDTQGTGQP